MASLNQTLEVPGLGNVDTAQLRAWLAPNQPSRSDTFGGDGHGDLGLTAAVVIVSLAAIKALAPLLVRQKRRQVIKKTDEYLDSDGIRHFVVTEFVVEAEWSEAEVIKSLGKATDVDVGPLLGS